MIEKIANGGKFTSESLAQIKGALIDLTKRSVLHETRIA